MINLNDKEEPKDWDSRYEQEEPNVLATFNITSKTTDTIQTWLLKAKQLGYAKIRIVAFKEGD